MPDYNLDKSTAWWNTGGVPPFPTNWKNFYTFGFKFNPNPKSTPVKYSTPQANNNNADNSLRGLLNLPSNQDIVNNYNEWRKNNPNAAGQDWQMKLANGVTLTEENVNNILNPYGFGKPDGVPAYVPEEVVTNQLLRLANPNYQNATEAQYQTMQNRWQPNLQGLLGTYHIGR